MRIILLEKNRYDEYAKTHPNYTFFQSVNYGSLMSKNGYNPFYIGLVDDNDVINAATLILVKETKGKYRTGYCPRGFLIDWNNENLVITFTNLLKNFLTKRAFVFIKIDPLIIYKEYNKDGTIINNFINNQFIKRLQAINYTHLGFNMGFESRKPRFNAVCDINKSPNEIYNYYEDDTQKKIDIAKKSGLQVFRGSKNDLELFYNTLKNKNVPLKFYSDFFDNFNSDESFEIYFARLEPAIFVKESKKIYEKEEAKNSELNYMIQDMSISDKTDILNNKMKSDELLNTYKNNMLKAINIFQQNPSGIIAAATAVVKSQDQVIFLDGGIVEKYKSSFPEYLLKWTIIEDCANLNYKTVNLNGVSGDFLKLNSNYIEKNKVKIDLCDKVVEYVGEFDLVIDKMVYFTTKGVNPIINWLNTPI